jgi:hypothetical protein
VFETLFRLIAVRLSHSRMRAEERMTQISGAGIRLRREVVYYSVYRFPRAPHHTVRNVRSGNRCIFRYVPRRADRPSLKTANAKSQREKY